MNEIAGKYDWVVEKLEVFVAKTTPIALQRSSLPGVFDTYGSYDSPECGRDEAISLFEGTIRPIFERFYPNWRGENPKSERFEFEAEREAAQRLIARLQNEAETERQLAQFDMSPSIQASGMHSLIWEAANAQWNQGNHPEAVNAVGRAVNTMLQNKVDRKDLSEVKLVQEAFSAKDPEPGKPRLRFDLGGSDDTNESFCRGAMQLGFGCFSAIRNPLAHLDDEQIEMGEDEALESLAAFSLFARWIDKAMLVK